MARTPIETTQPNTEITPVQDKNVNELIEVGQQAGVAQAAVLDSFEAIKAIGRIEAAQFSATVSEKLIVETAIKVRESKKYKGLPYVKDGVSGNISTFDEFCEIFLGKTGRRIRDLINNHNLLGEDLYEQAEKIGFRQRDYNALKALPADDRLLIAQAIEEENLDKALDLMQEMAAKHVLDKEALTTRLAEQSLSLEAKDRVIKDKTEELNKKAERLAALEHVKSQPVSAAQALIDARSNLQITAANLRAEIATRMTKQTRDLLSLDKSQAQYAAALVIEIKTELDIVMGDFGLPSTVSEDQTPEWMKPGWEADLEKQYAGLPTVHDVLTGE